MKQKQFLLFSMILFMSYSDIAFSADKKKRELPTSIQRKHDYRQPEFDKIDCNEDKMLQESEIDAEIKRKFDRMDLNNDGFVDKSEKEEAIALYAKENVKFFKSFIEKRSRKLQNRLRNADRNNDKTISKQEYINYIKKRYNVMDMNGDNELTIFEFRVDTEKVGR